jgi:tRNA-dihydrouridine synthase A
MLDWTDRHYRYMARLMSKHVWLYTEMVTTGAIIHGDKHAHLRFNSIEQPVALQLGGSDPQDLATCARIAEEYGYDEVNLNVGCPSDRVQKGRFGACLMKEPELVAQCVEAMADRVSIPITVKSRRGVDDQDRYEDLHNFVETVSSRSPCKTIIIHARKAWLKGLSPKQNREKPPLQYERVFSIKKEFPHLNIELNGGVGSWKQADELLLQGIDGIMIGRAAYYSPSMLLDIDQRYFGEPCGVSLDNVFSELIDYAREELNLGTRLQHMSRHWINLFQGQPGAKLFRRHISENAFKKGATEMVLKEAFEILVEHRERANVL